ncbi:MAG: helix-turn-helix transcriptional regulator [Ruminococcaceae bacterium]|nr:helix-turn-helix transcriptional regulator [Oscillospiraceae bacterium]
MDEDFIRQRITQLRIQKNVSEYKMSMDLGHSKGYIQSISSGRALPSMSEFLYICEYFGITPLEFFDTTNSEIIVFKELNKEVNKMEKDDVSLLIEIAKRLNRQT